MTKLKILLSITALTLASLAHAGTVKFSGPVSRQSMANLVAQVQELSRSGDRNITVQIGSSDGGDLTAAINARNELRRYGVNTYATSQCASACTVVFAAGRYRSGKKGGIFSSSASFMFHRPHAAKKDGEELPRDQQRQYEEQYKREWLAVIREVAPAMEDYLIRKGAFESYDETWVNRGKAIDLGFINN